MRAGEKEKNLPPPSHTTAESGSDVSFYQGGHKMATPKKNYALCSKYEIYLEAIVEKRYTIRAESEEEAILEAKSRVMKHKSFHRYMAKAVDVSVVDCTLIK